MDERRVIVIMSTAKRKHGHSSRSTGGSGGEKRSKGEEEKGQDTDSKRQKVETLPPFVPPTRENGGMLGGLPLYGELLPADGYTSVPVAARETCKRLADIILSVKDMKSGESNSTVSHVCIKF